MKLRIRLPTDAANLILIELDDGTLMCNVNAAIAKSVGQAPDAFEFLAGVPPKRPKPEDGGKTIKECLRNGDILNIQPASAGGEGGGTIKRGVTDGKYVPPIEVRNSIFVKYDVPGDNSCLFHSVGWIFDKSAPELRKMVAEIVLAHPDKYTAGFLGSSPPSYAQWIQQKDSWGGAIEIDLLCNVFQMEIAVLDMTSKKPQVFGQGNGFTTRGFVVYTGNHYDGGGIGNSMGGGALQRVFSSRDERPMALADDYLMGRVKAAAH